MDQSNYVDKLIKDIEDHIHALENEIRRMRGLIKILKSKPARKGNGS